MGLTSMERQAQKRLSDAKKRTEQQAIKSREQPLSGYAKEVKDRIVNQGQSYEQATSGASERRDVTSRTPEGAPIYGDKAEDPAVLAEQALRSQQLAEQRLVEASKRGNIEALRGAEKTALGATQRQRVKTGEEAFGQRRGIKTESAQAGRSLAQYLASRGLGRSGAAVGGQLAQNVTLQEGLGQSRAQEATRLGDIGQAETDIRTQTASGIAQAGQQAEAQRAQLEIARIQQESQQQQQTQQLAASRQFEEQQFQRNQNISLAAEQRQLDFQKAQAKIDLALEEARRTDDFEQEKELIEMKAQNALTLKQTQGGGTVGSGRSGGLTPIQTIKQFNDQVDSLESGLDSIISRGKLTGSNADDAIIRYMELLRSQGVDPEQIAELGRRKGASGIIQQQPSTFQTGTGLSEASLFGLGIR
jgi:hypothetical protein